MADHDNIIFEDFGEPEEHKEPVGADKVDVKVDDVPAGAGGDPPVVDDPDRPTEAELNEARTKGWKPENEYTGKGKWVDAREFLRRESPTVLRAELNKTQAEFERFRRESMAVMHEVQERTRKQTEAEYEAKYKELVNQKKQGFDTGNFEVMDAADRAIRDLEIKKQMEAPRQNVVEMEVKSITDSFYASNPWYGKDRERTLDADIYSKGCVADIVEKKVARGEQPFVSVEEYRDVLQRTAQKFGEVEKPRQPPPSVTPAKHSVPPPRAKGFTFDTLPKADQELFRAWQRRGIYKNTGDINKDAADFIRDYDNIDKNGGFTATF